MIKRTALLRNVLSLFTTMVLAMCVLITAVPTARAYSLSDYFVFSFQPVQCSKTDIYPGDVFYINIAGEVTCIQTSFVTAASITTRVVAQNQTTGDVKVLNAGYTTDISPFPVIIGEIYKIDNQISLQFPKDSLPGSYNVRQEVTTAQVQAFNYWFDAIGLIPSSQAIGSVNYIVPSEPMTTVLTVDPVTGTYGDAVSLSATLTSNDSPLSNKSISFTLNGTSVGSAATNGSGLAILTAVSLGALDVTTYKGAIGASYAEDTNYTSSSGTSDLTVIQASSITSTKLSLTAITPGNSVTDVATVTGPGGSLYIPSGTVDFQVSTDNGLTFSKFGNTETLNDGTATSESYTPIEECTYYFRAVYIGDTNYSCSQSPDNADALIVSDVSSIITASADANGSITPSGAVNVNYGANQNFTITPDNDYRVENVLVDGLSVGAVTSYSFNNVTANHTIDTSFAINTYSITASAGANGSITPVGAVAVNSGTSQTFTITPNNKYCIASVLVDGLSVGAVTSYTFSNITADHTIAASFASSTLTIVARAGTNGSIVPSGTKTINYGSSLTFTLTPKSGYHVDGVLVDGLSVGAVTSYTFSNVTVNHTITASFAINTYTITASAVANGTISPSGVISVNNRANQTFKITPSAGFSVAGVLVDGRSVGAVTSYTFRTVTANHTITASFTVNTNIITASVGTNGSISPSGMVKVNYGTSQTFTITPKIGYHVTSVLVDRKSVGAITSYTFNNVTAKHTISASFARDTK